jgi:hypothetical protein
VTDATLETTARRVLGESLDELLSAGRAGLDIAREARAGAEPMLGMIAGINQQITRINAVNSQIQEALDKLKPYSTHPKIQPFVALLTAMQPITAGLAAAETAKLALAALAVPDPQAAALSAVVGAVSRIEQIMDAAVLELVAFVEEV